MAVVRLFTALLVIPKHTFAFPYTTRSLLPDLHFLQACTPHIEFSLAHCRASPGHVIRCSVGSALRLVVWVSLANVTFAALGRAQGFWAAKVTSASASLFLAFYLF